MTIGTKISLVVAGLLIGAVASLVWLSTRLFIADNTDLIQRLNTAAATDHAAQVREVFERLADKLMFAGQNLLHNGNETFQKQILVDLFERDESLLGVLVYEYSAEGRATPIRRVTSPVARSQGSAGDWERDLIDLVAKSKSIQHRTLQSGDMHVERVVFRNGLSGMAVAIPFIKRADGPGFSHSLVGFVLTSKFFKEGEEKELVTRFVVDRNGVCLSHSDPSIAEAGENLSYLGIVQEMRKGKFNNGQAPYVDSQTGESRLGAFQLAGFAGVGVVAEVPQGKASEAALWVQFRACLLGVIILCVSVLVGNLFADTITSPIYDLVRAANRITRGDFKFQLSTKSRDEIGYLSRSFNAMAKGLQKLDSAKKALTKFHSKEIAEKMLAGEINLGGERKRAVVFISDIRNFTELSESLPPEKVVEFLNEYLSHMVPIILRHGGFVDKFMGDAIMAVWGVPNTHEHDLSNALAACLAMRVELAKLNEKRVARKQTPLYMGMGLHAGEVTVGNIGSNERMEYTVIGDTVNMASRIEAATKIYGTDLLVEKSVSGPLGQSFLFDACDLVHVKGKSQPLELFRVKGFRKVDGRTVTVETPYSSYPPSGSDKAKAA